VLWDVLRAIQRWPVEPGPPLEERVLQPGEKVPDVKKLNAEAPQSEWREGPNGQMQGPWQFQYVVYLFHEETAARYTWTTGTVGGAICIRDLVERTHFMRQYNGAKVHAVVTLSDTYMPTRYGGRQRPAFIYKRWIKIGGEPAALPTADKNPPKAIEQTLEQFAGGDKPAAKPAEPQQASKAQTVAKPTAKQVTGDEIRY
jgi:hypothetical protein